MPLFNPQTKENNENCSKQNVINFHNTEENVYMKNIHSKIKLNLQTIKRLNANVRFIFSNLFLLKN
jgi:hypothetical protein